MDVEMEDPDLEGEGSSGNGGLSGGLNPNEPLVEEGGIDKDSDSEDNGINSEPENTEDVAEATDADAGLNPDLNPDSQSESEPDTDANSDEELILDVLTNSGQGEQKTLCHL